MVTKNSLWLIYVEDWDQRLFAISCPVSGAFVGDWISVICEQQDAGRSINGQDIAISMRSEIEAHAIARGYSQVDIERLISLPSDRSLDCVGHLPEYAREANRAKLVKIICKGCDNTVKFAELNNFYPGESALKHDVAGEFVATCLKCGRVAKDAYNWHR